MANYFELERTGGDLAVSAYTGERPEKISPAPLHSPKNSPGTLKTNALQASASSYCGSLAVLAECESEQHRFAKRIYCGKEWCETCGADDSPIHKQRMAKWLPKFQQIESLGYFVIEFPDRYRYIGQNGLGDDKDEISGWCRNKADLKWTTDMVVRVLGGRRGGDRRGNTGRVGGLFPRGLIRWHWFGDKAAGKYNPHLNIVVDGEYISNKVLDLIKTTLRQTLCVPDLIVNYQYTDKPSKMMHLLRYITRATFRKYEWSPYMAHELFNFRNCRWWGNWKQSQVWETQEAGELTDIVSLQSGKCPCCGLPLKVIKMNGSTPVRWSKPVDARVLDILGAESMGDSGYYMVSQRIWDKSGVDQDTGEYLGSLSLGDMYRLSNIETNSCKGHKNIVNRLIKHARDKQDYWDSLLKDVE